MNNKNAHTAEGMLYGAYVGKIKYLIDQGADISLKVLDDSTTNLVFMTRILDSINLKGHLCPNDIRSRIEGLNVIGSVQYAISPLAFADIFGLHGHELDEVVKQIVRIVNRDEKIQLLCVELIHLLHDILWFKIERDGILEVVPEFDVLESEVVCSEAEKDIFFAALWSFIFSEDYVSCYEKAANLENTNSDITGLACTFAGLYYGIDSIPIDWSEQVFEKFGNKDDGTPMLPII